MPVSSDSTKAQQYVSLLRRLSFLPTELSVLRGIDTSYLVGLSDFIAKFRYRAPK